MFLALFWSTKKFHEKELLIKKNTSNAKFNCGFAINIEK